MKENVGVRDGVSRGGIRALPEKQVMSGHVWIINKKTGEVVREFKNLVTTVGKGQAAKRWNGVTADPMKYIALGTGTTAAAITDTALEAEVSTNGGSRAAGTCTTDGAVSKVEHTFNFTGDLALTEIGLLDAASASNLGCRQVFAVLNVKNGDQFIFRWENTFGS